MSKKICEYCKKEHLKDNTGCENSGNCNSGYYNSGDYNSGNCNSGYYNSGYYNSGDYNSGYYNSGYYNSGYYNSGYYNSGWFNTNEPKMRFFNKDSDITYSEFQKQSWRFPDLKICAWVELNDLSKDEQTESAKQMGGLLKTLTYKEAWKEYWGRTSENDKEWFKNLPNFDKNLFLEITSINVGTEEEIAVSPVGKVGDIININGKNWKRID